MDSVDIFPGDDLDRIVEEFNKLLSEKAMQLVENENSIAMSRTFRLAMFEHNWIVGIPNYDRLKREYEKLHEVAGTDPYPERDEEQWEGLISIAQRQLDGSEPVDDDLAKLAKAALKAISEAVPCDGEAC